jgi:presenilin-like A22 family membrane protease
MAADAVVIDHPNRRRAASRITQVLVVVLLLVSAVLIAVVTIGGWAELQGAKALQIAYIVLDVFMAFLVARWNRGVLPVAAALAIVMLIFALIAGPQWFERDKEGFAQPGLDASVLGLVTLLLVPVQALLVLAAMSGFRQAWNVEVERRPEPPPRAAPQPG